MSEGEVLNQCQQLFPHLTELINDMKVYYSEKLWHQLTEHLLTYIRDEQVLKNGPQLTQLYNSFIKNIEKRMDPIKFVRFIQRISEYQGTEDQKIQFIDNIHDNSVTDEQARFVLQLKRAEFLLIKGEFEQVDNIFKEIISNLKRIQNIDTLVQSSLYKLGYQYNKIKKNYDELYKYGLQFLAYTSDKDISAVEKFSLSLEMAQAIIISKTIYNFSELLEQPVLQSLKDSEQGWVYNLLETYNSGNVDKLNEDLNQFSNQIQQHELLSSNKTILQEKIRIMAFLDLVFNQPKNQRNISFQKISETSKISLEEVELLLMRAMAIGLIKGRINQIESFVSVDWILPRVLDNNRIKIMSQKLENWQLTLQNLYNLMQTQFRQQ